MARSGKSHPRDDNPGWRKIAADAEPAPDRVFRITEAQRQHIADCLRAIDEARETLDARQSAENREVIRRLRAAADEIFDLLNELEETGEAGF